MVLDAMRKEGWIGYNNKYYLIFQVGIAARRQRLHLFKTNDSKQTLHKMVHADNMLYTLCVPSLGKNWLREEKDYSACFTMSMY